MIKGRKGQEQLALICFTGGIALCTPCSWLISDWYNGDLGLPSLWFKLIFTLAHLMCATLLLGLSVGIHASIDTKESER